MSRSHTMELCSWSVWDAHSEREQGSMTARLESMPKGPKRLGQHSKGIKTTTLRLSISRKALARLVASNSKKCG